MSAIRKFGYNLGVYQSKHPYYFVTIALVITLLTIPGIPLLLAHVEPSLEKVLPPSIEEIKLMNDMRSQYGADMFFIVITPSNSNKDLLNYKTITYLDALANTIRQQDYVVNVQTIADSIKKINGGIIPQDSSRLDEIITALPSNYRFLSADKSVSYIQIQTDTGSSAKTVTRVIEDIRASMELLNGFNPGVEQKITGFSAIDHATFSVIISDFAKITAVSFALMVLFLLIHYRFSIKKTLYSLVIMVFALIWALGVTGYIGIQLNVVTMVAAAMIMALGSSYGINSVYHFYDDFMLQYPKTQAIAKFQEFLIVGLTGSALAEIAGFMALLFGLMPSMRDLGIILAIGISFSLFVSVMILPAFFYLLEPDHSLNNEMGNDTKSTKKRKLGV